jgi:Tfp pilus assembly protein PilE
MIKVNLIPLKKKKKAKPLPTFLIVTVGVALLSIAIVAYLNYFFASRVEERNATVAKNEKTLEELAKKIKARTTRSGTQTTKNAKRSLNSLARIPRSR